jgi:antitoxin CcdA
MMEREMSLTNRYRFDAPKKATNLSLNEDLLLEAKARGINLSKAAERGLCEAIAEQQATEWLVENKAALESSNEYVEKHGLPLARYRQF